MRNEEGNRKRNVMLDPSISYNIKKKVLKNKKKIFSTYTIIMFTWKRNG